jgi:phosphoglycolate phosphatase
VKYKLVIFDFDGTLADTFPWVLSLIDQIADKYHIPRVDRNEIDELRNYSARRIIEDYHLSFWKMAMITRHVRSIMAKNIHQVSLFSGIEELLQNLADQGITLAMVSSNSTRNIKKVLGPEIVPLFDYYECGVSLFGKSARIKKVLRKSGVMPHEAISIGDEIRDFEAALTANIPFGAVAWGYTRLDALKAQAPQEIFTSVAELAEKIG